MKKKNVIILGAAGRDFHDFNTYFRDNEEYNVKAFTATQIPDIVGRTYPSVLAGKLYPKGIPIKDEKELSNLIKELDVDECVFSYSDVPHEYVMHLASTVLANGADFRLIGPKKIMLKSSKPVIAVCAVRTGSGKSQTSRKIVKWLKENNIKAVAIRHPMPYGDLAKQAVQRFETYEDMDKYECTIEEMEEYEPYIQRGLVVYAGVDYEKILRKAEKEANVIIWDGGNNDVPFYKPDLHIVVADPHRAGHELKYHPGETNLRMANVIIINKVGTAKPKDVEIVLKNIKLVNPNATVIKANSPVKVENEDEVKGKKVVVVEDGPTLTHGEMPYGAGYVAAKNLKCEIIDPRKYAVGTIKKTFEKFKHLTEILPAMGYGKKQMEELQETINKAECDAVIIGTPIDLGRHIKINKPSYRVEYNLEEIGKPDLKEVLDKLNLKK